MGIIQEEIQVGAKNRAESQMMTGEKREKGEAGKKRKS